jgi:hypothetical protein
MVLLSLGILASSILCTGQSTLTPEETFWKWFQSNENSLFDFEKDQERVFDRLGGEMRKINPNLTFEFGPKENGIQEFIISADGIKEAFPEVERLYAAAPSLPRWKFAKFRPRRTPLDITYQGVTVRAASVVVEVKAAGQMADLTVFIPGYTQSAHQTYVAITFLLLDEALGEYDVETRIGRVNVESAPESETQTCSLEDLPRTVDARLPVRNNRPKSFERN